MDYKIMYEQAIKRAKAMISVAANQEEIYNSVITIFPELKESEDEKIRKDLIRFIKGCFPDETSEQRKTYLAWLEKQGKQKSVDEVKPKFKVGDTMRTLQEANDGYTNGMPVVVSIDKEYYHCTNELIAIKDQDDYEYPPINKKQSVWSEEDEKEYRRVEYAIMKVFGGDAYLIGWIRKFKNILLHQITWKPSDEQMDSIDCAVRKMKESACYDSELVSLFNDLKKLRGE